jgi:hypothetical protein
VYVRTELIAPKIYGQAERRCGSAGEEAMSSQQLRDAVDRLIGNVCKHVTQIGFRVKVVQLG